MESDTCRFSIEMPKDKMIVVDTKKARKLQNLISRIEGISRDKILVSALSTSIDSTVPIVAGETQLATRLSPEGILRLLKEKKELLLAELEQLGVRVVGSDG